MSTRSTGISLVVEVTDEGPGVPPELGARIFERSVSGRRGTGLGLAVARELAEADGGRLELVQQKPAMFALFLSSRRELGHSRWSGPVPSGGSCPAGWRRLGQQLGEHPAPVGPEPERRPEAQPDDVGRDVVGQPAGEVQQVVGDRQAAQRDHQADAVEQEEQGVLPAYRGAAAPPERPVPVADVGDRRRHHRRERLGGQRLVGGVQEAR